MKVYCTAEFKAKEGREDELFNALRALEKETHEEEGCVQYKVMRKIENQFAQGEHYGILMNEIWATEQAFEEHCQKPHIANFFESECLSDTGSAEKWNVNLLK